MLIYHTLGKIPAKRHTVFRQPDGRLYQEQLAGMAGFAGVSSLLYHTHPPTRVRDIRQFMALYWEAETEPSPRLRHFRSAQLEKGGSAILDRVPLLFNEDVALSMVRPDATDEFYYRNAAGDELVYVARGSGVLESQFGELPYQQGDYLVIPRGILHRYQLNQADQEFLVIESQGMVRVPERYHNPVGQLLEGAPFCERDIRRPGNLITRDETGEHRLLVKRDNALHEVILDHHPCDVVGWDGYYYPWAFSIHDFEPIVGRIHQPPPVHQTFQGDGFVVCSFVPRLYDFDPNAIPAPYNHSNIGCDELLFYCSEEFMSRKGIEFGSLTLHPDGMTHGPHPGTIENSIGKPRTDELAVMLDTFKPLRVARPALEIEDAGYQTSWLEG